MFTTLYLSAKGNIWQHTGAKVGAKYLHVGNDRYTRVYVSAASKNAPRTTSGMQVAYCTNGQVILTNE